MSTVLMVVNYGTPVDLWNMVSSAERFDPGMMWIVHNNHHPNVDSSEMMTSLKNRLGDRVIVSDSNENLGHGSGINRCFKLLESGRRWSPSLWASVEYSFIVNPDCLWTEPIVGKLGAFLEAHDDVIAVGPKQLDSRGRVTAGGIEGSGRDPKMRGWQANDPGNRLYRDTLLECPTASGAALFVRAKEWWKLGGMLEGVHYYSETWPCYHARAHGWKVAYHGEVSMIHEWHRSSPKGSPDSDGRVAQDREAFRRMCDEHGIEHD